MQIIGGTYRELCREGNWDQLFGSGFRAAAAVSQLIPECRLDTFLAASDVTLANTLAQSFGFKVVAHETSYTICFRYDHGLSTPYIFPPLHLLKSAETITLTAESALLFGMVDGDARVEAHRLVYDPQSTYSPKMCRDTGSRCRELAIVCNQHEAGLLTNTSDPSTAAKKLLAEEDASVVVVKCGSQGAVVVTTTSAYHIPAYATPRVWPIGSGDVFAAVFAAAWAGLTIDPVAAANFASKATAYYCYTQALPIPSLKELDGWVDSNQLRICGGSRPKTPKNVYLAGPFFSMMERWLVEQSRDALMQQGMSVFSPYHDVGLGEADKVVPKDIDAIHKCNVMFAILDQLDSGTLFEVGYARSLAIPVVGFCQKESAESLKMLVGTGCTIFDDFVTAIYNVNWVSKD